MKAFSPQISKTLYFVFVVFSPPSFSAAPALSTPAPTTLENSQKALKINNGPARFKMFWGKQKEAPSILPIVDFQYTGREAWESRKQMSPLFHPSTPTVFSLGEIQLGGGTDAITIMSESALGIEELVDSYNFEIVYDEADTEHNHSSRFVYPNPQKILSPVFISRGELLLTLPLKDLRQKLKDLREAGAAKFIYLDIHFFNKARGENDSPRSYFRLRLPMMPGL